MISEKGRTNQSPCQFLGPSSTVFHLWLWQFSFYWIVSSGVKSSIDVFLPILSVWFSLDRIPLLFWLWLWLHSKWKPTLRILGIQASNIYIWSVAVTYIYLKCVDSKLMNMFYLTMLASLILLIGRFLDFDIIFLIH